MAAGFFRQYRALVVKHALIAKRNPRATILQLGAVIIFMLLLLIADKALQADDRNSTQFKNLRVPHVDTITNIPLCNADLFSNKKPCHDLIWSPNTSFVAQQIVANIVARNDPPLRSVLSFASVDDANAYLLQNPETALAGVHFTNLDGVNTLSASNSQIQFGLQVNETQKYFKGTFQDPMFFIRMPLQVAVERESARFIATTNGDASSMQNWNISYSEFAHPAIDTSSVTGTAAGNFIFAAALFGFVLQLGDLVYEKERGLRQALRTVGMTDAAYWLSWLTWQVVMNFFSTLALIITGLIMQLDIFLHNSFGLSFMTIFLFEMAMTSMAVPVSVAIRRAQTATNMGFVIFLVGWIIQIVIAFGFPFSPSYYYTYGRIYSAIFGSMPWSLLSKALHDMGLATASKDLPGLTWGERASYCKDYSKYDLTDPRNSHLRDVCFQDNKYIDCNCVMSIDLTLGLNTVLFVGYFISGIYLDNIYPNENGVYRPLWYIFMPSYWSPKVEARAAIEQLGRNPPAPVDEYGSADDDVKEEENRLRERLNDLTNGADIVHGKTAIELFALRKVFGSRAGTGPFVAVQGSWFQIERGSLFCLLGPNGAGKTTTINMLTGVLPPSAGEALIYGESLSSSGGIDRIRGMMGVCPQFDVLWDRMTGREHLQLYGAIKGVADPKAEAARLLETVKLTDAAGLRSMGYSGGMKRRLSVAIALLGDPKVVYLDEPTTGMDPVSRRYVWDIIEAVKRERAIILTTHSMEEAEILGDRIAIMAKGKLQVLGNSVRLKTKYGAGYNLSVSLATPNAAGRIKDHVRQAFGIEPYDETKAYVFYALSRNMQDRLPHFLKDLEARGESLGVADVQLSMSSLEEVFLAIAKKAELEAARAMGGVRFVQGFLRDGTAVQVPLGADFTAVNGVQYAVKWAQDEDGNLTVADMQVMSEPEAQQAPFNGSAQAVNQQNGQNASAYYVGNGNGNGFNGNGAQHVHVDAAAAQDTAARPASGAGARNPFKGAKE